MAGKAGESALLSRLELGAAAWREVALANTSMVNDAVGRMATPLRTTARTLPGINTVEPEPIGQIEAAHATERTAHALIADLIQLAREAGRSWYEIGNALDLHNEAVAARESIADVAYYFALEHQAGASRRELTWTCPACQQPITDHGPFRERPDRDEGHSRDCARRTAELAEWRQYETPITRPNPSHAEPTT